MIEVKVFVPISKHQQRLLTDDKYYKRCWKEDYEECLSSVTVGDYNMLVQLCFGRMEGNAWIGASLWKKDSQGVLHEVDLFGAEPMFDIGETETLEDGDIRFVVEIGNY